MQLQICNFGEVWTSVSRVEAHRVAQKRTGALSKMIRETRAAEHQENRDYRRAEQGLQAEIREGDRRNRALWKPIRVRPDHRNGASIERKHQKHQTVKSGWPADAAQLPRYSGQIIDRMGRAGIFFRVRYYGASTKAGVGRRSTTYIWSGAHQTADGQTMFMSNVGEAVEEAVAALEAVELFNRETQDGAKVLFHTIANVPYQFIEMDGGIERMFEIGQRFAEEQFGSRNLPYALALHPPSEEGDQRNWHLHLIFSTRPLVRTGDHEWDIGRMMRREIDNPEAFEEMRHLYARIQSEVAQEAGLNIAYTALSNVERGLPNAPQKHLGTARTARVRRGEQDEINEINWATMLAGETALLDEHLRHEQERAAAELALLQRVECRALPLEADISPGPGLSIAMTGKQAEPIASLADTTAALEIDLPFMPALPIANMQQPSRTIADLPALGVVSQRDASDALQIPLAVPAFRGRARSIGVLPAPSVLKHGTSQPPIMPSIPATRTQQLRIAKVPQLRTDAVSPAAPQLSPSLPKTAAVTRTIAKLPPWLTMQPPADPVGLSLGLVTRTAEPSIAVVKPRMLVDEAANHDVNAIFRLIDARRADVARRERVRRERIAAERAQAERSQKARDEEQARADAERQRLEAAQLLAYEAEQTAALDAMLETIEAERIFVRLDGDRCVVDDTVVTRFGVMPAIIDTAEAQARLDAIGERQRAEMRPIVTHAAANGADIVQGSRGWTLSPNAPERLRLIADAWMHEPLLKRALGQVATAYRKAQVVEQPAAQAASTGKSDPLEMLVLAANQRKALTQRWQQGRRFDELHAARGSSVERGDQQSKPAISPVAQVHRDPGRDR